LYKTPISTTGFGKQFKHMKKIKKGQNNGREGFEKMLNEK